MKNIDLNALGEVKGWYSRVDQLVIEWLLSFQHEFEVKGDLVELGVYEGKSAIHIGAHLTDKDRFYVCDLFEEIQVRENIPPQEQASYRTLTQSKFEDNYLKFHPSLPFIVRGLSSEITQHVGSKSCRFIHVAASHVYESVKVDADSAKSVLVEQGVVAFDDYRSGHTPGVALAVWEQVLLHGLTPICITDSKFYGTWGNPEPYRQLLFRKLAERTDFKADNQVLSNSLPIIRIATVR
jgi:hypothetical protein